MKRVRELAGAGYLRAIKPRVSDKRLYTTTAEGVKLLRRLNLWDGLQAIHDIDYRTFEHDEWVTDVRIAFDRLLDLKDWICERQLKKQNQKRKVPDGIIPRRDWSLIIEVERTLKKKRYYERVLLEAYARCSAKDLILYITANETDKQWLMKIAADWKQIYFVTMKDVMEMGLELVLENTKSPCIEFRRENQGGVHFNDPDVPAAEPDGLDDIYEGERERERIEVEYLKLKAQGLSEKEIDELWGIKD